jgi:hypothetical protein
MNKRGARAKPRPRTMLRGRRECCEPGCSFSPINNRVVQLWHSLMFSMRSAINLVEGLNRNDIGKSLDKLAGAIESWAEAYDKDDAHSVGEEYRALEREIIGLAKAIGRQNLPNAPSGMIYRGTGIDDTLFLSLMQGKPVRFQLSPSRLFTSWTKNQEVADRFAKDAWADGVGMCAVTIAFPAAEMNILLDVDQFLSEQGIDTIGEEEVLVLNKNILLRPENVVSLYKWEHLEAK